MKDTLYSSCMYYMVYKTHMLDGYASCCQNDLRGEAKDGTEILAGSEAFTIQTGIRYYDDDRPRLRDRDWDEHLMGGIFAGRTAMPCRNCTSGMIIANRRR